MDTSSSDMYSVVERLTRALRELPQVIAVVLAGSRAARTMNRESDFDLYVYALRDVPVEFRRGLLGAGAESDHRFCETGDEWTEPSNGIHIDIMYRSPEWVENQIDLVLVRQEAAFGYTTCFLYNVDHSEVLFDPRGWYRQLQSRVRVPYPEGLRRAVVVKNWPVLRRIHSSCRRQISLALNRNDAVSVQHRVSALLLSFFDVWFALQRELHPGEKRMLSHLPEPWASRVRLVIEAPPQMLLNQIDALLDPLDARLVEEGLLAPTGHIAHAAAWVSNLERACAFYERWFNATSSAKYSSKKRPFISCFLSLGSGARLELMTSPDEAPRMAHIAISVGSRDAVDRLAEEMRAVGVAIVSHPRITGDGHYEAVVTDTEGNLVEITS